MKNLALFIALFLYSLTLQAATLVGWAEMKRHTYTVGPESAYLSAMWVPPGLQAVQGFSGGFRTNEEGVYYFVSDNGYGSKNSSASVLLRLYQANIKFNDVDGSSNSVDVNKYLNFNDIDARLSFKIQADYSHYYNDNANNLVDSSIREKRLLTGADLDPESIRMDKNGNIWIGEEFGPFLVKTNQNGKVLRKEISIPNLISPDSPHLDGAKPTIQTSAGFEGMAINPLGNKLYPMLEKSVIGDPTGILRLYQFDIDKEQFDDISYKYQLDKAATEIRELTAINEKEFLVIEQNTAVDRLAYKKVYHFSIEGVANDGLVTKTEVADLMNISDPNDLNRDDNPRFIFPFATIENLIILDSQTLLIANDNNFQTRTFFIKLYLDKPLNLAKFIQPNMNTSQWSKNTLGLNWKGFHSLFGWITVFAYLLIVAKSISNLIECRKKQYSGAFFWLLLVLALVLLSVYRQYNLQLFITQFLRDFFHDHGWYESRKMIQKAVLEMLAISFVLIFLGLTVFCTKFMWRYKITITGFLLLLAYKVTEAISYHIVDQFLMRQLPFVKTYHLLELIILGLMLLGAFVELKTKQMLPK